jgi:hypothetical protein
MGKISNKRQLLEATVRERNALLTLLSGLTTREIEWPGAYGWSARDHVGHLSDWERLLIGWYETGVRGEPQQLPAHGYTWKDLDAFNRLLRDRHLGESFDRLMEEWHDTSDRMFRLMEELPEKDVFTPGRFEWAGRSTLASLFDECGPKHYRWAAEEIKRGLKARR